MPPSDAMMPLASYGRNTSFCALVDIWPSASRYFWAMRYWAGLPDAPSACETTWMACASACAIRGLAFGGENRGFLRALGVDDLRLLLAFGAQNRRRFLAFRRGDDRAARPLRG